MFLSLDAVIRVIRESDRQPELMAAFGLSEIQAGATWKSACANSPARASSWKGTGELRDEAGGLRHLLASDHARQAHHQGNRG